MVATSRGSRTIRTVKQESRRSRAKPDWGGVGARRRFVEETHSRSAQRRGERRGVGVHPVISKRSGGKRCAAALDAGSKYAALLLTGREGFLPERIGTLDSKHAGKGREDETSKGRRPQDRHAVQIGRARSASPERNVAQLEPRRCERLPQERLRGQRSQMARFRPRPPERPIWSESALEVGGEFTFELLGPDGSGVGPTLRSLSGRSDARSTADRGGT